MSRCIDLFIAFGGPLDDLAALLDARTPFTLVPRDEGGGWELHHRGTTALLDRHGFLDDGDLPLSRYPYDLAVHTNAAGHLGSSPEVALLRDVAADLDDLAVLLVLDLQYRDGSGPPDTDAVTGGGR